MIASMFSKLEQLNADMRSLETQRSDVILSLRRLLGSTFEHDGHWYQTYVKNEGQENELVRLKRLKSSPKDWYKQKTEPKTEEEVPDTLIVSREVVF